MRRFTFCHTTLERLLTAQDVTDLFYREDPFEKLWKALRSHRLRPLPNRIVGDRPVDIMLKARGGNLGIRCTDGKTIQELSALTAADRWILLNLPVPQVEQDMNACLRQIGAALIELGGSVLNLDQTSAS